MVNETPEGHFQYPDPDERWYKNGETIEVEGNIAEQQHDGIVDWLEQLEIRLTGIVETFDSLPEPDPDRTDPRTGSERVYLVRNRETFYRDTGTEWVVTGGDLGDAVGAGDGLTLGTVYEIDHGFENIWTATQTFDGNEVALSIGDQNGNPLQPGDVTRNGTDILVHSGNQVINLSDVGTGGGSGGTDVIASPNLNIQDTELPTGERITSPVSVGNGQTLTVKAWGVRDTDNTTPANLFVELLDETNSVVTQENTAWNSADGGVAEWTNDTGARTAARLSIFNNTGVSYTDPDGVGGQFGYVTQ